MTRDERRIIQQLHDSTERLLEADNYAKTYMARIEVRAALQELLEWDDRAEIIREAPSRR